MFFIFTIALIFFIVFNIQIHSAILRGNQLTALQTSRVSGYLWWCKTLDRTVYKVGMILIMLFTSIWAWDEGAYLSSLIIITYMVVSTRTQFLIDAAKFEWVETKPGQVDRGMRLKPVSNEAATT